MFSGGKYLETEYILQVGLILAKISVGIHTGSTSQRGPVLRQQ